MPKCCGGDAADLSPPPHQQADYWRVTPLLLQCNIFWKWYSWTLNHIKWGNPSAAISGYKLCSSLPPIILSLLLLFNVNQLICNALPHFPSPKTASQFVLPSPFWQCSVQHRKLKNSFLRDHAGDHLFLPHFFFSTTAWRLTLPLYCSLLSMEGNVYFLQKETFYLFSSLATVHANAE